MKLAYFSGIAEITTNLTSYVAELWVVRNSPFKMGILKLSSTWIESGYTRTYQENILLHMYISDRIWKNIPASSLKHMYTPACYKSHPPVYWNVTFRRAEGPISAGIFAHPCSVAMHNKCLEWSQDTLPTPPCFDAFSSVNHQQLAHTLGSQHKP